MARADGRAESAEHAAGGRRPLAAPALALMAGICLGRIVALPAWAWMVPAAVVVLALAASLRVRRLQERRATAALVLLAAALLGAAWFTARSQTGPRDVSRLAGDEPRLVTVEGVLIESPRESRRPDNPLLPQGEDSPARYTGMFLAATSAACGDKRFDVTGRLRVVVGEPLPDPAPRTGDRVTVTGLLRRIGEPLNPGQANIREIYAARGIHAALRTDHWAAARRRGPPWWSPYGWMGRIRALVWRAMPAPETTAGRVLPALFLGDRSGLVEGDELAFVRAGALHYLAVSGIHVALLCGLLIGVMRIVLVGPRVRAMVLVVFIIAYALATEVRPSVVRAGTFFLLLSLAWLLGRRREMLNTLAAATIVVLVLSPADLFHAGFQLSFLVALGLMTVCPRMRDTLFRPHDWTRYAELSGVRASLWRLRRWFVDLVSTCLTAWLFAAPLAAWHFHVVAPVGILATVALLPLVFALLVLTALRLVASLVPGVPADLLAWPTETAADWLSHLVSLFSRAPWGHFYVREFGWPWVAAALALLLAWAHRERLGLSRLRLGAALAVAVAAYAWIGIPRGPGDTVRVTTLAVGSGNTVLVQSPGGHSVLVDCGSSLLAERTGEQVTVPALHRLGVARLDAVVLTHADADHVKDLPAVLDRIPADVVYLSRHFLTDEKTYDNRVVEWLESEGFEVRHLARGDALPCPAGVELRVLGPPVELPRGAGTNASSVVLRVACGGRAMILTGDATPESLAEIAGAEGVRADAALLPHHGEESEELVAFLEATGVRQTVMSVGRFRDEQRKSRIAWPDGLEIFRTYRDGAVSVYLSEDGVRVETFVRQSKFPRG